MGSPFYRKSHRAWYVQIGKRQVRLAADRAEAMREWHRLMSLGESAAGATIREAVDEFLASIEKSSSSRTVEWYRMFLDRIVSDKPLVSIKPIDVTRILNAQEEWGQNTRHNFARAVKRLTRWSREQGIIENDPLEHYVKPAAVSRDDFISPEQMAVVEHALPDGPVKDLLVVAWETGMRPQEIRIIEARHLDGNRILLPASEAKGGRSRVIYVGSDRAMAIIQRLAEANRAGPIFRNTIGKPWCRSSINSLFRRLEKVLGFRTHLGAFRKGYCTQGLKSGVDTVTMSHLMGHSTTTMVSRVYAKVHMDPEHMLAAARKVTKGTV